MNSLTTSKLLKKNDLFRNLGDIAINRLAGLASRRIYDRNAQIFSQGDKGDALYGVASGRVRIGAVGPDGREVFLNIMEPGDTFGEIAVVDGGPRTAGAMALDQTTLIVIKRSELLAVLQDEPQLALNLLELFCQRLRWTSNLVEESALLLGAARVAKRLLALAALHGRPSPEGMELRLSQAELAHFLGTSRQMVNQHLQEWRKRGWINLARSRITVRDANALGTVARDRG